MSTTNEASAVGIRWSDGEAGVTGSHVLQIKDYSSTKGFGSGALIKSSTFSAGGLDWYIKFYPVGNALNNPDWISIFLRLDHIHVDAVDVKARFKFSVLDYSGESTFSLESTVDAFCPKTPSWGFPKFVKRNVLEKSSYLKDDCLKVRCDVIVSKGMLFVFAPPSNMHRHFGSLLLGAVGADVTFEVAGEMFSAHRCVLAARSPVFMAEFFGPMKERAMNSIRIQDMEAMVFEAMLHFIYTDTMPGMDEDDAFVITQHLLVAADRYDLERLKLICENRLCNSIDISTVVTTLALAEQHGCHGLKKVCFEFLKSPSHLKTVMATEGFDHLMITCPSLIKELLAKVSFMLGLLVSFMLGLLVSFLLVHKF